MVKKADLDGDKSWASEGLLIAARLTRGVSADAGVIGQ